jgi:hypothetical protein
MFRVLTPSGVIADGAWRTRGEIPARIPDRFNHYFDTSEEEIIEVPDDPAVLEAMSLSIPPGLR